MKTRIRPGDILVNADGSEELLVGDVNELGGVCDDCCHPDAFSRSKGTDLADGWWIGRNLVDTARREQWIAARIQEIFPAAECLACLADSPEDGSTHIDHFFDLAKKTLRQVDSAKNAEPTQ